MKKGSGSFIMLALVIMFTGCVHVAAPVGVRTVNTDINQAEIEGSYDNATGAAKFVGALMGEGEGTSTRVDNLLCLGNAKVTHRTKYSVDAAGRPVIDDQVSIYTTGIIGSIWDAFKSLSDMPDDTFEDKE